MEIHNNPEIRATIPIVSSLQQRSESNISYLSALEQNSADEVAFCCDQFYQLIVSCFTSIINWIKSFFSSDLHETPPLSETKSEVPPQRIQPLDKKEGARKRGRLETKTRRKYNGTINPGADLMKKIEGASVARTFIHPGRSAFSSLYSPPSTPIIKSEDLIRIHALNIEPELILVCFKPGKPFFLDEEDADVRVIKGDTAWDTIMFNDGLDEDLKKKLAAKVIQAIQKTNVKLLYLPTFCQSLVPHCDGLEIKFSDHDFF